MKFLGNLIDSVARLFTTTVQLSSEVALQPVRIQTFGTKGGGAFKRASNAWLLKFYFIE